MKLAIHEAVVKNSEEENGIVNANGSEVASDSLQKEIYNSKCEALQTTIELNDEKRILSAVKLIEDSKRIQIIALGAGSLVARNFASMLIQIGKSVIAEVDTYIQLSSISVPHDL